MSLDNKNTHSTCAYHLSYRGDSLKVRFQDGGDGKNGNIETNSKAHTQPKSNPKSDQNRTTALDITFSMAAVMKILSWVKTVAPWTRTAQTWIFLAFLSLAR